MPLNPGTRLGSYEIGAPIGAGGMGEVYRARDTKLNRDVAIKVLPEHLARDPAALARFEREAQAVAALSHPNILAIHDFGVATGTGTAALGTGTASGTGTAAVPVPNAAVPVPNAAVPVPNVAYAVTELLEGETLRAKLSGSALPARKAVEYALQIVQGIAAAHRKGVIHRDLKPENIFITQDGRVKILDFGLAKAMEPGGQGEAAPTQGATGTSPGTVMGTVGYMSPEQVRGLPVDHRTDIFSFGVVLYEMLAGLRPFRGDSNVETMNAILKEDPPEIAATGVTVPPALDRIVRRCLEKSADERFHSAHDLGLALETLSSPSSATSGQSAVSMAGAGAPATTRGAMPWLVAVVAVVLAALSFYAGHRLAQPGPSTAASYHRLTFGRAPITSARYAPDGKTMVYATSLQGLPQRLYSTREESPDSLTLGFPNADVASISSSGELALVTNPRVLAGYARIGTLARASLSGGAARAVLENVQSADWLPDGSGFAVAHVVDGRYHLEFPVGKSVYDTGGYVSDVRVSPDGKLAAFIDHPILGDDRGSVAIVDREGKRKVLAPDYSSLQGVAWSKDGREIWFTGADKGSARALFAVTTAGALRTVTRAPASLHLGDLSADGKALVWSEDSKFGVLGHTPGINQDRDLSWLDWSTVPRLSEDGKTLVFTEEGDGGGADYSVYMRGTDGSPAVRLGPGLAMALSPDGKWVLALRLNPEPGQFILLPTGAGEVKTVTSDSLSHGWAWFTPDGTQIIFAGFEPGHQQRLYIQALSGGAAKPITPEGVTGPPSPDGKLVATTDGKLFPLDGGTPRPIPGYQADDIVERWAAEPGGLFVRRNLDSGENQVFRLNAAGRRELVHRIAPVAGSVIGRWFAITADGATYAITYGVSQSDLYSITGLK